MPSGPLPDPNAQRRNASTIPTTDLPAEGFEGEIPAVPSWVQLGRAGLDYWNWVWRTPEACGWGTGSAAVDAVAKRASFEDDLAAIELAASVDLGEMMETTSDLEDMKARIESTFKVLGKLAGGKLTIIKEMGRLDGELGLTPKARQALRWTIAPKKGEERPQNPAGEVPPEGTSSKDRLRVVNGGG